MGKKTLYMTNILKFKKNTIARVVLFTLTILIFLSCGGDGDINSKLKEKYELAITLKNNKQIKDANKLLHEIIESKELSDDLKVETLFAIAQLYYDAKSYSTSIDYFKKLLSEEEEDQRRKKSLFMIAYIYNNHLDMYTDAINYYNQFLREYSNDELVPSVKYELEQINTIIKRIEN